MSDAQTAPPSTEQIQQGWHELNLKVAQLETARAALEHEHKALRQLLETVVEHRRKSHNELVILLTNLVSKLPINDVGGLVAQLLQHDTNVNEFLVAVGKGKLDGPAVRPEVLKTLDQTKRDLSSALNAAIEELLQLGTPLEPDTLRALAKAPDLFFSPKAIRANRCFVKGQVSRERILREFGLEALPLFQDITTDPKLNPRPKPEEILLAFKPGFTSLLAEASGLSDDKKAALLALHEKVQTSRAASDQGRLQRNAFQRLSFITELLHYYEHQNTEAPDVVFAQRLPVLLEQLVIARPEDYLSLDEKLVAQAEALLAMIISPNHRHALINNLSKGSQAAVSLKFVLKLRSEKPEELDGTVHEFVRHLIPVPPQKPPTPEAVASLLRLAPAEGQRMVVNSLFSTDRLRKSDAEALARAVGTQLGLKTVEPKAAELPPEVERQIAWAKVKDMIARRTDARSIATAIRERLHAKYEADEIRQSWVTLTEADPISLIRVFCLLPYLSDGTTDPIARTLLDTYVSRLTHEKYGATFNRVLVSLKSMHHAKPDSPTLLNFLSLVRWVSPEAADKISHQIGMAAPAPH
jgi:hypothetical protein